MQCSTPSALPEYRQPKKLYSELTIKEKLELKAEYKKHLKHEESKLDNSANLWQTISQIRGEPGTLEERVIKTTTEIQAQKDVQAFYTAKRKQLPKSTAAISHFSKRPAKKRDATEFAVVKRKKKKRKKKKSTDIT